MQTLLTEPQREQLRNLMYVAVSEEFRSRMPPRFDPSPLLLKFYKEFETPNVAEERDTAMREAIAWARNASVPPWRDTYADEELRREALGVLLQNHQRICPKIHPAVVAFPSDRHRWVYLLFRFQRFNEADAVEVTGLSRNEFRRYYFEAREVIHSHLSR